MLRRYPNLEGKTFLVCIGAAKCGTSWLHHYLGTVPEVAVSPLKELHFFNAKFPENAIADVGSLALSRLAFHLGQLGDGADNLRRRPAFQASVDRVQMMYDDDAYFGHFARLCSDRTRCFCDLTPAYSTIGREGFTLMQEFAASQGCKLRLLFIMRDPIDRFWSQLRHLQQMKPDTDMANDWANALTVPALNARADYAKIVSALDENFSPDDLLYLFYEHLFTDGSLRRLCSFAGVSFAPGASAAPKNETTVKLPLPDAARAALARQLAPQYSFCRQRFGDAVPSGWQG